MQVVPRGDHLAAALRDVLDALEVPELGAALESYVAAVRSATDAQAEEARDRLQAVPVPDARRHVIVVDPLEEVFAEDDAASRETLFTLLGGPWSLSNCQTRPSRSTVPSLRTRRRRWMVSAAASAGSSRARQVAPAHASAGLLPYRPPCGAR